MRPYSTTPTTTFTNNDNFPHKHNTHHHPLVPQYLSSILWFGLDDSSTSPRVPIYGCSTRISTAYAGKGPQDGVPSPLTTLDLTKAFWVQNMVSNFVYSRWYKAYPILKERRLEWLQQFQAQMKEADELIREQYGMQDMSNGVEAVTKFTVTKGDEMHKAFQFRDFFHISEYTKGNANSIRVQSLGFTEEWKEQIVSDAGERYKIPQHAHASGNDINRIPTEESFVDPKRMS